MASNRELRDRANTLGKALGIDVRTAGLGNADLEKLVADLEAKPPTQAEEPPAPEARPPAPVPAPLRAGPRAPKVPHYVAPGKAIVINSGVAGPLTPVKASDFQRGQADLDHLVARGLIIRT